MCSGEEGRLVPQRGVPGNMGEVSWLLFGGLRLPAQGDYIWFQRRLGISGFAEEEHWLLFSSVIFFE